MARNCKGINSRTGRLKKGYRYKKGGGCPVAAKSSGKGKGKSRGKCAGLKAKNRLKKGFTWKGARGGCPRKVG